LRAHSDAQLIEEARVREIPIKDPALLRQALTHKSFVSDQPLLSNERLEFLGDSVLNQIVAERLFQLYPDRNEGELAKARSLVVCKTALAAASRRLNVVPLMVLGSTEEALGGRSRSSLVADAYEALLAVVYLENGQAVAKEFVIRTLAPELATVDTLADWRDPKTTLQELCQSEKSGLPFYRIIGEQGKPHDRTFTAEVLVDGVAAGSGSGKSKKDAEQAAAQKALECIAEKVAVS
jgi:ribonuclease III